MLNNIEKKAFNAVFFLLLLLPLLFANRRDGAISAAENRALAPRAKEYNDDGTINTNYFKDTETWFNDNLGFRDCFVALSGIIKYYLFSEIKDMPLGKNGALAPFDNLSDYQHTNLLSESELSEYADAYQTVYDYLAQRGSQVYYMQCWDKHSIYPEQYNDTIEVFGDVSKSDQLEKALIEHTDINVIPIKKLLISNKDRYKLYGEWSDPWHWNQRGAYVAYTELIKGINANNDNKYKELTEDDLNIEIHDTGLRYYNLIHKKENEEVIFIKEPHALKTPEKFTFLPSELLHATYYTNESVDNDDTILIIGDSYFYGTFVVDYLAENFHTTIMFNGDGVHEGSFSSIIDAYNPDIVIIENAERCNYRYDYMKNIAQSIKAQ